VARLGVNELMASVDLMLGMELGCLLKVVDLSRSMIELSLVILLISQMSCEQRCWLSVLDLVLRTVAVHVISKARLLIFLKVSIRDLNVIASHLCEGNC